jgi:hypothetical protein
MLVLMKHPSRGKSELAGGDSPTFKGKPNGFLARAANAGFEDDINALVNNYVLDAKSRAHLRSLIDRHGLSGGAFATPVSHLQLKGKIAQGFYYACLTLHFRIAEAPETS